MLTVLKLVLTRRTAPVLVFTGVAFFERAEAANLAHPTVAKLDLDRLAVYQRVGNFFVGGSQKICRGGAGDPHLLCSVGLMKMLQIVQTDYFIFIGGKGDYAMRVPIRRCKGLVLAMDYSRPGSSVHGISQARILEWVARNHIDLPNFESPLSYLLAV